MHVAGDLAPAIAITYELQGTQHGAEPRARPVAERDQIVAAERSGRAHLLRRGEPVTAALYGRRFVLHVNDTDAMGWAAVTTGSAGDEVWLDRSFDGGRTWGSGSRLGLAGVPAGSSGTRTVMVNVDDWNNRGVGALRACGKAGDRP